MSCSLTLEQHGTDCIYCVILQLVVSSTGRAKSLIQAVGVHECQTLPVSCHLCVCVCVCLYVGEWCGVVWWYAPARETSLSGHNVSVCRRRERAVTGCVFGLHK